MRRFDLVVFDWDGTLVDSTGAIVEAIQAAAVDLGLPMPTREQASWVIGLGLLQAVSHACPTIQRDQIAAFVERYRFHYLRRDGELQMFAGVPALLQRLDAAGVPIAVATGKSRVGLNRALERTGLGRLFATTRCADEGAPKPDPWMLRDICDELGVPAPRAVMVGDTTHDVQMAQSAGAASVGVLYGAHDRATLAAAQPDALAESVPDVERWLRERLALQPLASGDAAGG
ncbi:MAG TPA: HAD-IA family hydrolase [Burkholderiaceae bacterium]|jgi:phosphoglycolate phosphatase|nr:HAD-IA family hydrolase [Burkholderiaceae bacterium]